MQRTLEPEILDTLPPDHPDALRNRRDLRLTNVVMGNYAWFARTLPRLSRPGDRILEIGSGTGELGCRLASRGIPVDALDLWPRAPGWPAEQAWHQADLRTFSAWPQYDVLIGNLIFHQFADAELRELGGKLHHLRAIVACEPLRRVASQWAYRAIAPLLGANYVTMHDAHVSIAAGFRERELADALGLSASQWTVEFHCTVLGAYRMIARRK
jgi:2-polyprenyl-3-methyl-5-hydroxy-6-metoxy-1,4-benzoquinol methylase